MGYKYGKEGTLSTDDMKCARKEGFLLLDGMGKGIQYAVFLFVELFDGSCRFAFLIYGLRDPVT